MSVEEDVDPAELLQRLNEEKTKLVFEVERGKKILANPGFVQKAPAEKLALEKEKLAKNTALLAALEEKLAKIKL